MLEDMQSLEQATRLHLVDELLARRPEESVDGIFPDVVKLTAYVMDGTVPEQDSSPAPARPAAF